MRQVCAYPTVRLGEPEESSWTLEALSGNTISVVNKKFRLVLANPGRELCLPPPSQSSCILWVNHLQKKQKAVGEDIPSKGGEDICSPMQARPRRRQYEGAMVQIGDPKKVVVSLWCSFQLRPRRVPSKRRAR